MFGKKVGEETVSCWKCGVLLLREKAKVVREERPVMPGGFSYKWHEVFYCQAHAPAYDEVDRRGQLWKKVRVAYDGGIL